MKIIKFTTHCVIRFCSGKIFLVIGLFTATDEETYVDYVMDDERDWDDIEWVEQGSEVISEEG